MPTWKLPCNHIFSELVAKTKGSETCYGHNKRGLGAGSQRDGEEESDPESQVVRASACAAGSRL